MAAPIHVKTTADGRAVEVKGLAVTLAGQVEAFELIKVADHPNRRAILAAVPEATHMAGRVPLDEAQAATVFAAFARAEAEILAHPTAIAERFRLAVNRRAMIDGIE
ncbi:hypothetical protein DLJ53_15960 [Acuticoccus sediminis]|uniref:Uncharacterized protein n=1 Tax=Acuticoccus sediminis TaxID=2184697 RepID=A0A8B2NWK9_9HYPH|nr:hypothetical protein [Acuticoccus sediminis]RAI00741.1 hypothetical protein DLJ53_15960 [Acuticoccus sediminis]